MLHHYQHEDIEQCLPGRRVTFVGDSTVRQLYWALIRKLDAESTNEARRQTNPHSNISYTNVDSPTVPTVEFFWDPYLNVSNMYEDLSSAGPAKAGQGAENNTAILVLGGGLWHARHLGDDSLQRFNESLQRVVSGLDVRRDPNVKEAASSLALPYKDPLIMLMPVLAPWYEALNSSQARTLTPERIGILNKQLAQTSNTFGIPLAQSYSQMIRGQENAFDFSGLHVTDAVADVMVDIFLNLRCNSALSSVKRYPLDKTCCLRYPDYSLIQHVIVVISLFFTLGAAVAVCFRLFGLGDDLQALRRHAHGFKIFPTWPVLKELTSFVLILSLCTFTDRTQTWSKLGKGHDVKDFIKLCALSMILGSLTVTSQSKFDEDSSLGFLSRNQTDEWKGWMQLVILTYHYSGVSHVLWIYKIVRLLVGSYLFMTGYGHTTFFLKRKDFSLKRNVRVLLHLNLLSCTLSYAMNTNYMAYYFAPLISFWYVVIYLTLRSEKAANQQTPFVVFKIAGTAIIVHYLVQNPATFEVLFIILKNCANVHWDAIEWVFRLELDCCIVFTGMLMAVVHIKYQEAWKAMPSTASDRFVRAINMMCTVIPILTAGIYVPFFANTKSKQAYNSWHPYISSLPILTYIILRNSRPSFRRIHSSIFAWVGRHSLETFTLQFHLWLAADTKGLLSTGLFDQIWKPDPGSNTALLRLLRRTGRQVDFLVITIVFLCVCWRAARATNRLVGFFVDCSANENALPAVGGPSHHQGGGMPTSHRRRSSQPTLPNDSATRHFAWLDKLKIRDKTTRGLAIRVLLFLLGLWMLNLVSVAG